MKIEETSYMKEACCVVSMLFLKIIFSDSKFYPGRYAYGRYILTVNRGLVVGKKKTY